MEPELINTIRSLRHELLHTEHYTFNDELLPVALKLFSALAELG